MKNFMLIVFIFFINCNSIDCGELTFDKKNKITFLNKIPYTGSCNSFFFSGDLKSTESYLNGKDDGKWIYYFINGNKQVEGEFSLGKKINKWTYYYENGTIWRENFYNEMGMKTGIWKEYNTKGELIKSEQVNFGN